MDYFQVRYAPGWNWSAMLKMTKIKLKFIPDPDIYLFLENDKRGVISNMFEISWPETRIKTYYVLRRE